MVDSAIISRDTTLGNYSQNALVDYPLFKRDVVCVLSKDNAKYNKTAKANSN